MTGNGAETEVLHEHIRMERDGPVVTVRIDRDGKKAACTATMFGALGEAFRRIARSDARVAVLTGANGDFCAGADLWAGDDTGRERTGLDRMRETADVALALHGCPIPVIAKVDGVAVGAGFGIALAADLLWCSERARFSLIFAKRGLSLDFGSSWLLARRVGIHEAKRLAFTAEIIGAGRARELGFVNEVVPVDELDAAVDEVAATIASMAPMAVSMTKRMLDSAGGLSLAQALEAEATAQNVNFATDDMREALVAFTEKRDPVFRGR
ncbi:MAG: enoyl-CoA hydratase/isomerase family protein [Acidimicrobiales bacterium]